MKNTITFKCTIVVLEGVAWIFRGGRPAQLLNEFLQEKGGAR